MTTKSTADLDSIHPTRSFHCVHSTIAGDSIKRRSYRYSHSTLPIRPNWLRTIDTQCLLFSNLPIDSLQTDSNCFPLVWNSLSMVFLYHSMKTKKIIIPTLVFDFSWWIPFRSYRKFLSDVHYFRPSNSRRVVPFYANDVPYSQHDRRAFRWHSTDTDQFQWLLVVHLMDD